MNLSSTALFVALFVLTAVGSFFAGRFTAPKPDPIVIRESAPPTVVTYTRHEVKTRTVTRRVVETVVPDGGTTTTTEETETEHTETDGGTPIVIAPSPVNTPPHPSDTPLRTWKAGALVNLTFRPDYAISYGVIVEYRVKGPVWVGAQVTSLPSVGLSAAVEF